MNGKWIYLAQRNPRFSREQFFQRWLNHRRIGVMPEMVAEFSGATYCAIREKNNGLEMLSDEYDGMGLFPLKGLHSIPVIASNLKRDYIKADELRFFTMNSEDFSMYCAEDVLRNGPETKAVVVQFLRRNSSLAPQDFITQWREASAELLEKSSFGGSVSRYIQNTVIALPPPGFGYDGIAEIWFESAEAMVNAAGEIDAMMASCPFINQGNSFFTVTDIIMSRPRSDL